MSSDKVALTPLGDRVIVAPAERESQSPGGIVIPDVAKGDPTRGKILAVGGGRISEDGESIPMRVQEGDEVLYLAYGGTSIELDGRELLILKEEELLAVFAEK